MRLSVGRYGLLREFSQAPDDCQQGDARQQVDPARPCRRPVGLVRTDDGRLAHRDLPGDVRKHSRLDDRRRYQRCDHAPPIQRKSDGLFHASISRGTEHTSSRNRSKWRSPSSHGPWPESALMWPANPTFTNSLAHWRARLAPASMLGYGAFLLATSKEGKGKRTQGNWLEIG